MPSRVWPLWALTGVVLAAFPAISWLYWSEVLRSGTLAPDGDSVVIPIGGSFIVTIVASPLVLGAAWFGLRRYNPRARIGTWRFDRPWRSTLVSAPLFALMALVLRDAVLNISLGQPWYEYLWFGYDILLVAWLFALRAAAIDQLSPTELPCY